MMIPSGTLYCKESKANKKPSLSLPQSKLPGLEKQTFWLPEQHPGITKFHLGVVWSTLDCLQTKTLEITATSVSYEILGIQASSSTPETQQTSHSHLRGQGLPLAAFLHFYLTLISSFFFHDCSLCSNYTAKKLAETERDSEFLRLLPPSSKREKLRNVLRKRCQQHWDQ